MGLFFMGHSFFGILIAFEYIRTNCESCVYPDQIEPSDV